MINTGLLHDVAEYVNSRVAKVVINGTYTITNFDVKAVTDNVLALNYVVPVAEVSLITLVELKDAADNVLTSNAVNVPITADHLMLQTIEVKEGVIKNG
ncbi:ketopantoate hydroxymethyltransferase [Paenibacillus sp. VCA1]|uniref:ketopantoate hydroxymethyltransferase n=1 Tax=Paenibacillus sp. VCA1 TaxID=3039148 RepID=UPI002872865A|nr:ketopantoate hydroxymethyltransferase [Paenibacillus sp. VCA1]MDR9857823.1 ketopantoate hydroxymethyltransferase [Paenibacillus sp. VCA1]